MATSKTKGEQSYNGTINSDKSDQTHSPNPTESDAPASLLDDSAIENLYAMINYAGSANTNMNSKEALTLLKEWSENSVSQLKVLNADLQWLLSIIDAEKAKLHTFINENNNNTERTLASTSQQQQSLSVDSNPPCLKKDPMNTTGRKQLLLEPDSEDTRRKRRKGLFSPHVCTSAEVLKSQCAARPNRNAFTLLKTWYNTLIDHEASLLPAVEREDILFLVSLARDALMEKLKMNGRPELLRKQHHVQTVALKYSHNAVQPSTDDGGENTEMVGKTIHYSALLTLMLDGFGKKNGEMDVDENLSVFIRALQHHAPRTLVDFLMNYQPGATIPGLDEMETLTLDWMKKKERHSLVHIILFEIAIFKYGPSPQLEYIVRHRPKSPPSVYIEWQLICMEPDYPKRHNKTIELLQNIKNSKDHDDDHRSQKTVDVLIRTLYHDGVDAVLKHLLPANSVERLGEPYQKISLTNPARPQYIALLDCDIYYLWICIIIFYLTRQLPQQYYDRPWSKNLRKWKMAHNTRDPTLLGIEWKGLLNSPLTTKELCTVSSMLLALLDYFNQMVFCCANDEKNMQHLMATIWSLMGLVDQLDDDTPKRL